MRHLKGYFFFFESIVYGGYEAIKRLVDIDSCKWIGTNLFVSARQCCT